MKCVMLKRRLVRTLRSSMAVRMLFIIEICLVPLKICVDLWQLLSHHKTGCFCHTIVENRFYRNAFYFLHNVNCLGTDSSDEKNL